MAQCGRFMFCNSTFFSVFTIKRYMGASAARARDVIMVKILNKCIPSILVYNLFQTDSAIVYIHRNISIHRYIGCLHETEIPKIGIG